MTVDWFKWLKHEEDPDNWDALDFEADLIELNELASQVLDAGHRAVDLQDGIGMDAYFDWDRRRRVLQFAADTTITTSFVWVEPVSFAQMWADA